MDSLLVMAAAPQSGRPGDIAANLDAILARIAQAREAGAAFLLLPELCLTGSGLGSLLAHGSLRAACEQAALLIAKACQGLRCAFGLPLWQGDVVYNALALVEDGQIHSFVLKRSLQTREKPFFSPGFTGQVDFAGRRIACDWQGLMNLCSGGGDRALLRFYDDALLPLPGLPEPPALLAFAAARPATASGLNRVPSRLLALCQPGRALAYANAGAGESTTDLVYPGDAAILQGGRLLSASPAFSFGFALLDLNGVAQPDAAAPPPFPSEGPITSFDLQLPFAPLEGPKRAVWCRNCIQIAAQGLATRMARIGSRAATLGVSGGLDSTLALIITLRAFELLGLHREGIYAVSLPALGSSQRTRENARRLMQALGLPIREIDITKSILQHFLDLGQDRNLHDTAYENAQARERSQLLMDKANQLGGLMVGSGDLSELALGFTTFGGDHMSNYGVNAGLYKSAIRLILNQVAEDASSPSLKTVLLDILDTPISPELLPAKDGSISQKTEELLGPYELNDHILHRFLADGLGPRALLESCQAAFGDVYTRGQLLAQMQAFFRRFFANQFKRNCLPDGPQVLGVSLSPRGQFTLPSDASAQIFLHEIQALTDERMQ